MAHVIQQAATASSSPLLQPTSEGLGDHERLFLLLKEVGPAPEEFMLYLSDPMLERENIFEDFEDEDES